MKTIISILLTLSVMVGFSQNTSDCDFINAPLSAGPNVIPTGEIWCYVNSVTSNTVSSLVIQNGATLRLYDNVTIDASWYNITYTSISNYGTIQMGNNAVLNASTYSVDTHNKVEWIGSDCDQKAKLNVYGSAGPTNINFAQWCCTDLVLVNGATNALLENCDMLLSASISELEIKEYNGLTLSWYVFQEEHTETYTVEYSTDLINWYNIDIVSTHGVGQYSIETNTPKTETYYRVKEIDNKGHETKFKSVLYSPNVSNVDITETNVITITSNVEATYYLYTIEGKLISSGIFIDEIVLDKTKTPSLLKVLTQDSVITKKVGF